MAPTSTTLIVPAPLNIDLARLASKGRLLQSPFPQTRECVWYGDPRFTDSHFETVHDEDLPEIDMSPVLLPEKDCNPQSGDDSEKKKREQEHEEIKREIARKLSRAAIESGFFRVTRHGVPEELIARVLRHSRHFFEELELEEKMKVAKTTEVPVGYASKAFHGLIGASQESLHVLWGTERIKELVQKIWPNDHPLRNQIWADLDEYTKLLGELGQHILELLFMGLNIEDPKGEIAKRFGPESLSSLRMNYYPPSKDSTSNFGIPAHTDFGALTILWQDNVGGLQHYKDGRWIAIKPKQNTLLINVGDIIQVLSNCKYISAVHRAVVNNSEARFSLAFSYNPKDDAMIKAFANLMDPNTSPKYKDFTWEQYRSNYTNAQQQNHSPSMFFRVLDSP